MIETPKSRGSGFFVKPDLIVTNAHVIAGFLFPTVTTHSGTKLNGRVAQLSDQYDLALVQVLRMGPTDAQLKLGQSSGLRLGQGIVALGWAQSLTQSTVTRGIVTGLRKDGDRLLVQTDATPNPGDSGGPLLDRRGEVIGVTTLRADNGSAGYAVAVDDLAPLVDRVTSNVFTVPVNSAALAVPAARQSDSELRRSVGLQRYSGTVAAVARNVASLDAAWGRYRTSCRINTASPGQTHEWFQLYDPLSDIHRTTTRCADLLRDLERQAVSINASMAAAAEAARQAGVYPGSLREIRNRYRLDYPGWDR
jgi:S1-C subfamily serine protease